MVAIAAFKVMAIQSTASIDAVTCTTIVMNKPIVIQHWSISNRTNGHVWDMAVPNVVIVHHHQCVVFNYANVIANSPNVSAVIGVQTPRRVVISPSTLSSESEHDLNLVPINFCIANLFIPPMMK